MKTQRNEVLKLTREHDGSVTVSTQAGKTITLPRGSLEATARYFADVRCNGCDSGDCSALWREQKKCCPDCEHGGGCVAFIVGKFFAPAGSAVASKVMFVARALPEQRW